MLHNKKALWITILIMVIAMAGCDRNSAQASGALESSTVVSKADSSLVDTEISSTDASPANQSDSLPDESGTDSEAAPSARSKEEILMEKINEVYGKDYHLSPAGSVNIDGEDCPSFDVLMNVNDGLFTTVAITEDESKIYELWLLNDEWTPWETVHQDMTDSQV